MPRDPYIEFIGEKHYHLDGDVSPTRTACGLAWGGWSDRYATPSASRHLCQECWQNPHAVANAARHMAAYLPATFVALTGGQAGVMRCVQQYLLAYAAEIERSGNLP